MRRAGAGIAALRSELDASALRRGARRLRLGADVHELRSLRDGTLSVDQIDVERASACSVDFVTAPASAGASSSARFRATGGDIVEAPGEGPLGRDSFGTELLAQMPRP